MLHSCNMTYFLLLLSFVFLLLLLFHFSPISWRQKSFSSPCAAKRSQTLHVIKISGQTLFLQLTLGTWANRHRAFQFLKSDFWWGGVTNSEHCGTQADISGCVFVRHTSKLQSRTNPISPINDDHIHVKNYALFSRQLFYGLNRLHSCDHGGQLSCSSLTWLTPF